MKFVIPGDRIGLVEEYVAGNGVYEQSGEILAAVAGRVVVREKTVSVEPVKKLPCIERDDVILGRVVDLRNSMALVELVRKKGFERSLMHTGVAALHVSNVQKDYLKDIGDAIGYMDIVKARVIDAKNLKLSTKEVEMGVLKAICSSCRHELVRDGKVLKCPNCGNVERRKISPDYGKGRW